MKTSQFSGDMPVQLGNGNSFYRHTEELNYHRVLARGRLLHRQKIAMVAYNEDGLYRVEAIPCVLFIKAEGGKLGLHADQPQGITPESLICDISLDAAREPELAALYEQAQEKKRGAEQARKAGKKRRVIEDDE